MATRFFSEIEPVAQAARNGSPPEPAAALDWLARARALGDEGAVGLALLTQGHALQHVGELRGAQAAFRAAQQHYREHTDEQGEMEAMLQLARSLSASGVSQRALATWIDCLELLERTHDLGVAIDVFLGVGQVYVVLDDFASALAYHELGLKLAQQFGDEERICQLAINVASNAYHQQSYERALSALAIGGGLLRSGKVVNLVWEAEVAGYAGLIQFARGEYHEAKQTLERALAIHRGNRNVWGQTHVLLALGETYAHLDQFDTAQSLLQEAAAMAQLAGLQRAALRIAEALAGVALRRKDYGVALAAMQRQDALASAQEPPPRQELAIGPIWRERLASSIRAMRLRQLQQRL
ncbi:tetratricopeptide repeat protein [Chitinibacteraceae bacterium HSL-7]